MRGCHCNVERDALQRAPPTQLVRMGTGLSVCLPVVVVGSCVVLVVVAWLLQIQWLMMASACIAIGEFLESTYYILVLKWAERSGRLTRSV